MKSLIHFFGICLVFVLGIILMNSQAFRVLHINPNIVLIMIAVLIVSRVRLGALCALFILLGIFSFIFFPFWGIEYAFIIVCGLVMTLLRSRFTGNPFGDIVILSCIGTVLFALLNWFFADVSLFVVPLIYEVVYNGIWAIVLLAISKRFLQHSSIARV